MWRLAYVGLFACSFHGSSELLTDGSTIDGATHDGRLIDGPSVSTDATPGIVQAGLIEDLDADVGYVNTTWSNQATGGDDVSGLVPRLTPAINGHSALSFDGSTRLTGTKTTVFGALMNGSGLTWFAVVKSDAQRNNASGDVNRNQIFGTIMNTTPFSGFTAGVNLLVQPYTMLRPMATEYPAQTGASIENTWVVLAGRLGTGTATPPADVYIDSGTVSGAQIVLQTGAASGALTIGAQNTTGGEFYTGLVTRILIYNRALSDAELAATGAALGTRYAVPTTF